MGGKRRTVYVRAYEGSVGLGRGYCTIISGLMLAFGMCRPECCYVGDTKFCKEPGNPQAAVCDTAGSFRVCW